MSSFAYLEHFVDMVRPQAPWRMRLTGKSMIPTVRDGDELIVVPQTSKPRFGDVIVFAHQGILVAHRVIGVSGEILAAGDASRGKREHVREPEILGTATHVLRHNDGLRTRLHSPMRAALLRLRLSILFRYRSVL
ncbi:MAG: S24/S26 family peptidase [Vulcanimicrobiaceae bacterium]